MDGKIINICRVVIFIMLSIVLITNRASATDVVLVDIYADSQPENFKKLNNSFYDNLKTMLEIDSELLDGLSWTKDSICKKNPSPPQNKLYGMALRLTTEDDFVNFALTLCDYNTGMHFKNDFKINTFLIDKFVQNDYPILFNVYIKRFLFNKNKEHIPPATEYAPFDKCNFSTFTLKNSLELIGMGRRRDYYHKRTSFLVPADFVNNQIITPFQPIILKEFLFRKILEDDVLIKTSIIQELKKYSSIFSTAFTNTSTGNEFYIGYKIKYLSNYRQAQIVADFFYSVDLEQKGVITEQDFKKYQKFAVENMYNRLLQQNIDKNFNEVKIIAAQHRMRFDTAKIIQSAQMSANEQKHFIKKYLKISDSDYNYFTKQYIRREIEVYGYEPGSWDLTSIHKYILDNISRLIRRKYGDDLIEIFVIGYADKDPIKSTKIFNPLHENLKIFYSPCEKNISVRLNDEDDSMMIVPKLINNNCQLSVLRAFVFAYKLNNSLEGARIHYRGQGIIKRGDKFYNRKVVVEIIRSGVKND